jgi:ribosome-binding factor A
MELRLVMTTHRRERVAELLQEILAELVSSELRDPRIGFVTITEVKLSPDLKHARIYVSKMGESSERAASVEALNGAASFLRRAVGRQARLKYVPDMLFVEDTTLERSSRLESLLDEIHRQDGDRHPEQPETDEVERES